MVNQTLANIIIDGMNNPDCSFFTGAFIGSMFIIKWLFFLYLLILASKIIDKLALEPLLDWIKSKIYKNKKGL